MNQPRSLFDKVWDDHVVEQLPGGNALLFVDLVVAHEITTPAGAREIAKRFADELYDPNRIVAINDHVSPAKDTATAMQAHELRTWAKRHAIRLHDIGDNGICHVVGPERGYVRPGMTVCCGDSHTCTLGALGAVAVGVGTTALAGAMLSGCLILRKPQVARVTVVGALPRGVTAKDLAMAVVARFGVGGATGCALEYDGGAVAALDMDQRLTLCNMAVEAGATTAIIAGDAVTARYLGIDSPEAFPRADTEAPYDRAVSIDARELEPLVTWGTNPGECAPLSGRVPESADERSLEYVGLRARAAAWHCGPGAKARTACL